jgi:hypothetical protein
MIQYGDLPHENVNERRFYDTAHTKSLNESEACHCCGKLVKTVVIKPGSLFVWCLKCF